ncbi:hypothetical protein Ancab_002694 [Ancistrocladus abbreviatus]
MKREGRQHGMVRTYFLLSNSSSDDSPESKRLISNFDSPATAGIFTRVSSKPTNHSKFTGKCGKPRCSGCRFHPVAKSRDKSKGAHKNRSQDIDLNFNFHGHSHSASAILDELMAPNDPTYYLELDYRDLDCMDGPIFSPEANCVIKDDVGDDNYQDHSDDFHRGIDDFVNVDDDDDGDEDGNDVDMGFVDVGFVWNALDADEGWSIVGEMW